MLELPQIDKTLCNGCGECIDMCPMEAIILKDGVAHIIEDNCSNCRACESICPNEAIT